MRIKGGERAGNNLFHSFDELSIPAGMEAIFENGLDIENIFTRVTGDSISNINGILSTQGSANLFLVNPNGIVFGENAALNVGGSFIATTADDIQFSDETKFSARNTDSKPILTIEFPIGLGFSSQTNSGAIEVNGNGSQTNRQPDIAQFSSFNRANEPTRLSVKTGHTLALIGGEINIKGGVLSIESGHIQLGSPSEGEVKFNSTQSGLNFSYEDVSSFKDINFSEKALADASGSGDGFIKVSASSVRLMDGSVFLIQNNGDTSSASINIDASQSLILSGAALDRTVSSIASETLSNGKSANIQVNAQNLSLQDGGNITTATFGAGKGGDINVNVTNSTQLFRTPDGIIERASSRIASLTNGTGDSGDIFLSTPSLKASTGSSITSGPTESGNGGSINIKADSIELDGVTDQDGLFTSIISGTFGTGNAGRLTIDTSTLKVLNGASVSTSSRNDGDAGSVTINASEQVKVSGVDPNTSTPSTINSSVTLEENEAFRQALSLPSIPNGKAGDLIINTQILNIDSGAAVSVENQGTGDAGTLFVNAENLNLVEAGSIIAASASRTGGNIELNTSNLEIDDGSSITATAENEGLGGNINISTANLTAKKTVK